MEKEEEQLESESARIIKNEPSNPIPLSFPAILINPRLKHLTQPNTRRPNQRQTTTTSATSRAQNQGRRRLNRLENANFSSNPHVIRPTLADYQLQKLVTRPTFPAPPPPQFPISLIAPGREAIEVDPPSAAFGSFNRSLKGIRKNIRRLVFGPRACNSNVDKQFTGGRVAEILKLVDEQLSDWIRTSAVWLPEELNDGLHNTRVIDPTIYPSSDLVSSRSVDVEHTPQPTIVELLRSPHKVTWDIPDPFARYLVHAVARYYGIVSFARQISRPTQAPQRLVVMVRAHLPTRQGMRQDGRQSLDTPPTTDLGSELSTAELSDFLSSTDDEHDPLIHQTPAPRPPPIPTSQLLLSPTPEPMKTPVRAIVVDSDDGDNSSRCASDTDELESHLSDSGFLLPKPPSDSDITPRGKPSWLRASLSQTPVPSTSVMEASRRSPEPAARLKLKQQQHQDSKKTKVQLTDYSVPKKSFMQWIQGDI
ncbi:uncharacterized protein MELLADRAFT_73010 [Melampsora larici-populina 98AG31]|uniref:R3H domain-containing protein n=1 Tax=Melampsora larici-populina (strain 98AG31 / pathotype 3-4-7) TaxID=747676 RepID=F4S1Z3_MELLP|nr:uncharacterized protein MELLADRAFT_73010 [Melampsora larici-populina 98AG31]EGG01355.1 hypothetical protein MELLADRAFT_73010 [Melampsora larici-populina 98AG31]